MNVTELIIGAGLTPLIEESWRRYKKKRNCGDHP